MLRENSNFFETISKETHMFDTWHDTIRYTPYDIYDYEDTVSDCIYIFMSINIYNALEAI